MHLPRNNWLIIGVAFGLWLLSWFFMMSFHANPTIGDEGYYVWTASKAALPLVAVVCMYALGVRTAVSRQRSKFIVHLTYLTMLAFFAPAMLGGMEGSLNAHDAPMGAIVDAACIAALVYGAVIFWLFRGVEIAVRKLRRKHDVA
jgi:hypothetical protein